MSLENAYMPPWTEGATVVALNQSSEAISQIRLQSSFTWMMYDVVGAETEFTATITGSIKHVNKSVYI